MSSTSIHDVLSAVVIAGHTGDEKLVRNHLTHSDARIRAASLGALERLGRLDDSLLNAAIEDPDPTVRRRAAEVSARHLGVDLSPLLDDDDSLVVEMAAWACGEQMQPDDDDNRPNRSFDDAVISRLIDLAADHDDALVRESAIAALGAIGDDRAVPVIIAACSDKPAIRRRAVLALAPFSGDEVDGALYAALEDRDWQVRQAAEDVLGPQAVSARGSLDDQQDSEEDEED